MKKYLLSTLAVAGLLACSTSASAQFNTSSPYLVGEAGYSFGVKNNGDAGILGLGAGYHLNDFLRGDIIASYRGWGDLKFKGAGNQKADVWSIPVLANIYATYPIYDGMGIYAMGGVGMSFNKTDRIRGAKGKTRSEFAWNAGAGIDYRINDCWSLDLGYRYSDLGQGRVKPEAGYEGQRKSDMRAHDVKLSARYYF